MNKLLYGKPVKEKWIIHLKNKLQKINKKLKLVVIQVGNNIESTKYINNKIKTGKELGIEVVLVHFEKENEVTEKLLLKTIEKYNNDDSVDGIIVQLPLPKHINEDNISKAINVNKDVDGFCAENIGNLALNKEGLYPCTPYGITKILDFYNIDVKGKDIVIVGRSNIVGKPMALFLINRGATVTICNSNTTNLKDKIHKANIVIIATGLKKHFNSTYFSENQIIIDVGIGLDENNKLCGDVDTDDVLNNFKDIALVPSPNGCGQTTVMALFDNLIKAYEINSKIHNNRKKK